MRPKSLKLNFIMNIILTMSSMLLTLIRFRYVSRMFLLVGTGKISFAIHCYFIMLCLVTYVIRACIVARSNKEKLIHKVQ